MEWYTEPESFCFCLNLRTGCLIIGYLGLILWSLGVLIVSIFLQLLLNVRENQNGMPTVDPEITSLMLWATWLLVIVLLLCIFYVVVYAGLLIGVYTKRPHFVRASYLALGTLTVLFTIDQLVDNPSTFIAIIIHFAIQFHHILSIRAYYKIMMSEQTHWSV